MAADLTRRHELASEQVHLDRVYDRLETMRQHALAMARHRMEAERGGSRDHLFERDVLIATSQDRLHQLDVGDLSLVFGRIDTVEGERLHVGRIGVLDEVSDPLLVDWRVPAAAPFYQATAVEPLGLARRRHLVTRGRRLIGLDDEVLDLEAAGQAHSELVGEGALIDALNRARTDRMGDIVATIQTEQDRIIRAPLPGVLVVQGGPGTGKTAVALHRAAYLLFTYQDILDGAVLVVGPNNRFVRYIGDVLPSLGETGARLTSLGDLYQGVEARRDDPRGVRRIKGDLRMVRLIRRAVRSRQRPVRKTLEVPFGIRYLRLRPEEAREIVRQVRQVDGTHNARRTVFEALVLDHLWSGHRHRVESELRGRLEALGDGVGPADVDLDADDAERGVQAALDRERERFDRAMRAEAIVRRALDRMWPLLSPQELLHDLFGSSALLRAAGGDCFNADELEALERPRSELVDDVVWTESDVPLLDEADLLLGSDPRQNPSGGRRRLAEGQADRIRDAIELVSELAGGVDEVMRRQLGRRLVQQQIEDESAPPRKRRRETFGHVIVDEAQDLSPMQWRLLAERCPSRSMTLVGDLGQASREGAATSWEAGLGEVLDGRAPQIEQLTVNYRTPAELMEPAAAVLAAVDVDLVAPTSVRSLGFGPLVRPTPDGRLVASAHDALVHLLAELEEGSIAVVAPRRLVDEMAGWSEVTGEARVSVLGARAVKGLEFDATIVVEPAELVDEEAEGLRSLYVALTRATQRLTLVHERDLPQVLAMAVAEWTPAEPSGG
ncbi:MAG: AAA family ATPase [Actinomycetia bacterium]|nr:AAA family ATPase [Actinomycetes bacterium]